MFSLSIYFLFGDFFICPLSLFGVHWLKCAKDGLFLIGNILKDTFQYELNLVNVVFIERIVNFLSISIVFWVLSFSCLDY